MRSVQALTALAAILCAPVSLVRKGDWPQNENLPATVSVRTELDRLQKQNGLTIALYHDRKGLGVLRFKKRSFVFVRPFSDIYINSGAVSHDGTEVAAFEIYGNPPAIVVAHPDGSAPRTYPRPHFLTPICWSPDNRNLLVSFNDEFAVLELESGLLRELPARGLLNPQCWSPDGKQIVYETDDRDILVYDFKSGASTYIAKGTEPTWSPGGNRIAFRDGDTYYTVSPFGGAAKKLFHKRRAISAVYWSPDSRFVAYVHQDFFALDVEFYHLMVRRLEDGSEDWVADGEDAAAWWCQWVSNPKLLSLVSSGR